MRVIIPLAERPAFHVIVFTFQLDAFRWSATNSANGVEAVRRQEHIRYE